MQAIKNDLVWFHINCFNLLYGVLIAGKILKQLLEIVIETHQADGHKKADEVHRLFFSSGLDSGQLVIGHVVFGIFHHIDFNQVTRLLQ